MLHSEVSFPLANYFIFKNWELELFYIYFIKSDIFESFIGKILHPSKQSLSQVEYKEVKLYCHNIAIMLQHCAKLF